MQFIKPFLATFVLFIFCTCVFGQNGSYPSELADYQFFGNGKLKVLQLLVSSKDDVRLVFGEKCETQCDYDADWTVSFEYFEAIWVRESSNNKGDKLTYQLDPKYMGKLRVIDIRPKKQISFLNVAFPHAFNKLIVSSTTDSRSGNSRMTVNDAFYDSNGLTYELYKRTNYDDIKAMNTPLYRIGDLVVIRYEIPNDRKDDLFVLQK